VGERGSGQWERITWDEAIDIAADKFGEIINKYGAESIAAAIGSLYRQHGTMTNRFLRALGSPNIITDDDICEGMGSIADRATCGEHITKYRYCPDMLNTKTIVLWGTNWAVSYNPKWRSLYRRGKRNNDVKLIVIDPRKTEEAREALMWLKIRPGTDGALAMGMMHIIVKEELYDKDFVRDWTHGFDKLCERLEEYTPERVAEICELPVQQIIDATRYMMENGPTGFSVGIGCNQHTNSTQTHRALCCLLAIMGAIDTPGGNVFLKGKVHSGTQPFFKIWSDPKDRLPREKELKRLGADRYPLWAHPDGLFHASVTRDVFDAMLTGKPYPVKGFFCCSTNYVMTHPNPKKQWEAFKKLDFLLTVEWMWTPMAEIADLILPTTHWVEENAVDVVAIPDTRALSIRRAGISPLGEAKDTGDMHCLIIQKMIDKGYIEDEEEIRRVFPWKSSREFVDWTIEGTGITFEQLAAEKTGVIFAPPPTYRTYEETGFRTPTKKVELHSTIFEKFGLDPLPGYEEHLLSDRVRPDLAEEFPYILNTGKRSYFIQNGRYLDSPSLRSYEPYAMVEISPTLGEKEGIEEGDWVSVVSPFGEAKFKAMFRDIHEKTVHVGHARWYPELPGPEHGMFISNGNCLLDYDPCDPYTSVLAGKGVPCKLIKLPKDFKIEGALEMKDLKLHGAKR
jgi:anaerobic selenocysteine-containing dehydrogenase